jgi:dienelactone hydrolase
VTQCASDVLRARHVDVEYLLSEPDGLLALPENEDPRCAVLVLSGSSGRVEVDRVRLLAARGAAALSMRWFGDVHQPPGICEVPLETFSPALDRLSSLSEHLAVMGVSKGAEAALLLARRDARIRAVAALSPSSVVWANVGPGIDDAQRPLRSSWTEGGEPLPFVPYDDTWLPQLAGRRPIAACMSRV